MYISKDLEPKDLIDMLDEDLSQDDAFELICAIEDKIVDVTFTERVIKYFTTIVEDVRKLERGA